MIMTQEEKARAYDKVVKEVKDFFEGKQKIYSDINQTLEYLFPELKESENERIRKTLIEYFNAYPKDYYGELKKSHILAWLEKQDEQKDFTLKVEPKFNRGDWITNGRYNRLVVGINSDWPYYMFKDGTSKRIKDIDKKYYLWTIQDAKDGDVLCTYECGKPKIVFILKGIPKIHYALSYHCYYNIMYHHFGPDSEKGCLAPNDEDIKPATKEQCNLLFQKIKEAGYEWDIENKELKKIAEELQLKEGKYYECIKPYYYLGGGQYWFDKGKVYFCEKDGYLRSDPNNLIKVYDCKNWQSYFSPYIVNPTWNEKDDRIIDNIETYINIASNDDHTREECIKETKDWIKSLKGRVQPQNRWKPSGEQISCLARAINRCPSRTDEKILGELLKQLNKQASE